MNISLQVLYLFIIALPIASLAWTVTHEEVVRELRDDCLRESKTSRRICESKFFYLFTCEYCFSHYVPAAFPYHHRFQASVFGLAWEPDRRLRFGMGGKRTHGHLRQDSARPAEGTRGDYYRRSSLSAGQVELSSGSRFQPLP